MEWLKGAPPARCITHVVVNPTAHMARPDCLSTIGADEDILADTASEGWTAGCGHSDPGGEHSAPLLSPCIPLLLFC